MTDHTPTTIGESLEQLLDRITFADPATHRLRDQWEETKRAEQEVFDRVCREEYEHRLEYHRICQTPNPEETARHETNLCTILFREELDQRLAERWAETLRRVKAVLADKAAAAEDSGSAGSTGNSSGT
jgi:hypothetical protein